MLNYSLALAMAVIGTQAAKIQKAKILGGDPSTWSPMPMAGTDPCTYAPVVVNGKNTWPGCETTALAQDDDTFLVYTPDGVDPSQAILDGMLA